MSTLDKALNNDFLMISKSLVPYLRADSQKSAAVFIKVFELIYTIDLFSREDFVRSLSRSHDTGWEKDFLSDVRKNLSDDRGYFIDAILKLTEVKDMLKTKNSASTSTASPSFDNSSFFSNEPANSNSNSNSNPSSSNSAQMIDKLSTLLEPNQLQILKVLSSFMK